MVRLQQGSGCGFDRTLIKRPIIRLLAAVTVVALCLASPSVAPASLPLTSLAYHLSPVPVVDWPQGHPFSATALFGGGASRQDRGPDTGQDAFHSFPDLDINSPVVLRGLPVVQQWAAFGKWSPRYLRRLRASPRVDNQNEDAGLGAKRKALQLKGVYKKSGGYFGPIWDEGKPMASLPSVEWSNPHSRVDMSVGRFFNKLKAAREDSGKGPGHGHGNRYYFVTELENLGDEAIEDVLPLLPLFVDPTHTMANVWLGENVTAHMHYDSYVNLNVQITGQKEFVLFPPGASSETLLQPHPFLHPSHAQAQLRLTQHVGEGGRAEEDEEEEEEEEEGLQEDQEEEAVQGVRTVLAPGDVLFIPPLWWHQVTSLPGTGLSASLNCWSPGEAASRAMAEGMAMVESAAVELEEAVATHTPSSFSSSSSSSSSSFSSGAAFAASYVRMAAASYLLDHVLLATQQQQQQQPGSKTTAGIGDGSEFSLRYLFETRYQALVEGGHLPDRLPLQYAPAPLCANDADSAHDKRRCPSLRPPQQLMPMSCSGDMRIRKGAGEAGQADEAQCWSHAVNSSKAWSVVGTVLTREEAAKLRLRLEVIAPQIAEAAAGEPTGVQLRNLLEVIGYVATGQDASLVGAFFHECCY